MVSDIYNSIYDYFKEKLVSPVSGVFVAIWVIFNWKGLLIVLFDQRPIIERIAFVTENYAGSWTTFWGPALFTLIYAVIYPFIVLGAFSVAEYADVWKRKLRFKLEEGRPFSPEEKKTVIESEREARKAADDYHQQLLALRGQYLDFVLKTQESVEQLQVSSKGAEAEERLQILSAELSDARRRLDEITTINKNKKTDSAETDEEFRQADRLTYQIYKRAFENLMRKDYGQPLLEWVVDNTGAQARDNPSILERSRLPEAQREGLIVLHDDNSILLTEKGRALVSHYLAKAKK